MHAFIREHLCLKEFLRSLAEMEIIENEKVTTSILLHVHFLRGVDDGGIVTASSPFWRKRDFKELWVYSTKFSFQPG
jgi:hypothetical protein